MVSQPDMLSKVTTRPSFRVGNWTGGGVPRTPKWHNSSLNTYFNRLILLTGKLRLRERVTFPKCVNASGLGLDVFPSSFGSIRWIISKSLALALFPSCMVGL